MREHEGRAGHVTLAHDVGIRREAFVIDAHRVEYAHVPVPALIDVKVNHCSTVR